MFGDTLRRRWFGFALALSLLLARCSPLPAATVTGTIYGADGDLFTGTMLFRTLRTPLVSGSTLVTGGDYRVNLTNGALSTTLLAGDYRAFIGADQKGFIIAVPSGSSSYSILGLITNAITYTDQSYPWQSTPPATASVSGTVKTDVDEGNPVVYLKSSIDALLATNAAPSKLDITNGAAVNLTGSLTNVTYDGAYLRDVKVAFVQNLQTLLSDSSPSVAKLAYVLEDDSSGDATRGTYRYDPTLSGPETATIWMCQDKGGNPSSLGRWVRMSAGDNYQMSVDTLDDALAVEPQYLAAGLNPTNNFKLTVKTRARTTLGKGGAKTYHYSASAPGATNEGAVVAYGGGYLLWDKEGDITPQMFRAKADGTNDDSTAIRAASLYAAEVGGRLYFPPGNYRLATNVFVHSNSDWSFDRNAWLVRDFGDLYQPYATVRNADFEYASTNAVTSVPASNTNIVIRGLKIRPASTNATGQGIALYGVRDVVIDGLTIQRTYGDWATAFFAENLKISNVEILENSALFEDGIHIAGGKNITVQNGTVNAGDDMLAVGYDGADVFCEDVVFNNITGKSGSAYGIKIFAPTEQTAGTTFIQRIAYNNIVGEFGRNRNGGIYISEFGTPRGAITNIVINNVRGVVNQGGASHDGVQPFGIYQLGGADITYRGVRMLGARQYPLYLNTPKGRVLFDDVQIDRPTALDDDSVIILQGGGAEIKFVNCEIAGSLTNAIWNQEANLRIINSKFTGSSTNVIEVKQATAASRVLEVRGTEFAGTSTKPVVSSGASNNLKRFEFAHNLVPTGSVFSGGPEFGDEVVIWGNTGLAEQSRMTGSDAVKTYIFGSGSTSKTRFVVLAGDTGDASLVNFGASLQAQTVSTSTAMTLSLNPSGGTVTVGGVPVALVPSTETLAYSSTTVTVTAGKGPNQSSVLTCTNNFTLSFSSVADNDGGTIWVHPAATNCTVTLSSPAYGPSGTTLTITGGTGSTNHTVLAWKATKVNSTNVINVNALNYYR